MRVTRELCRLAPNQAARAGLLHHLARLYQERLGDGQAAEACLLEVIHLAPAHARAVEQLTRSYSSRGDWGKAVKVLLGAEEAAASEARAARLQQRLAAGEDEGIFFPSLLGLPEDLSEARFRRAYVGLDSPEYQAALAEIDRRLDELPLYR